MRESYRNLVNKSQSILIILPRDPYFDQVASGLALYLSLKEKKDVAITCPSAMVVEFNRLVGVNKITSELGNKNMVISFMDYDAGAIERISSDVSNNRLSLKVIPKPGNKPPMKEQVELSFAGVSADLAILIGGDNENHFPMLKAKDFLEVELAHIGINELNLANNREVASFAKPAASISEIVSDLIKPEDTPIDQDIATNLLMGIYEGTKNFSSQGVTSETFRVAAELMQAGGKYSRPETGRINLGRSGSPLMQVMQGTPKKVQEARETEQKEDLNPEQKEADLEPPKEWMQPPKIMKGTSVS